MSLTELSLSHSYQSKLSKTGSSLDFPSLLFPAHAQYTLCTCSVKGFPSLLCLHMLSSSTQMHNFQGESSPAANRCIIYRTTVVLQQKNCASAMKNYASANLWWKIPLLWLRLRLWLCHAQRHRLIELTHSPERKSIAIFSLVIPRLFNFGKAHRLLVSNYF